MPGMRARSSPSQSFVLSTSSFARRIGRLSEAGLDAAALVFFPLLVVLPRGAAALVSVAGVCAAGVVVSAGRNRVSATIGAAGALLGCLVVWGTMSALWSIDPLRSLAVALRLAGLFAAGLALASAAGLVTAPRRLTILLLVGMALGIGMVAIELATAGGLSSLFSDRGFRTTRLNQASISFALLVLPATAALVCTGRKFLGSLLLVGTAMTIYALAGTAAKAVLFAGLAAACLFYNMRRVVIAAALLLSVAAAISAPLTFARLERLPGLAAAADNFKISAGHRLLIWSFAGDRIAERPLTGWGLDASRAMPGGADPIRLGETWMPLHPHNAALQVWLELGAPGAVLFALLAALIWGALGAIEWPRLFTAAAGASLMIAFVGCFGTYGIWQEWWLGTLAFCLFLILVMAQMVNRGAPPPRGEVAQTTR
jgi:exopolysaccharide production protein ExoQ